MKIRTMLLSSLPLLLVVGLAAQSVPEYVNYQGLLKAAGGDPLDTGNYTIEFNIYDEANGGSRVWGPFLFDGGSGPGHGLQVPVVNGSFNVIIGPTDTNNLSIADAFAEPNRFIEIRINGGDPIQPRQQFLSTAYTLQSQSAQNSQLAQMAVQASNLVQEAADALCPPGTIVAFGGPTNAIFSGWLLCDGRAVASTNYARLFATIGTAWGNGTFGSNGLPENPDNPGTDFNLPDLRGVFLRGVNSGRVYPLTTNYIDPDAFVRTNWIGGNPGDAVGSVQTGQFLRHDHVPDHSPAGYKYLVRISGAHTVKYADNSPTELDLKSGGIPLERGGNETRPVNAYVNYIIKY